MVNGYVTLDLASKNIYKESLGAIKSGKPVMVVDAPNVYFADTISVDGDDNVVITKGGKTITIANDNTITNVGDVQPLMENIVDLNGRKRFVEFDNIDEEVSGLTITYSKTSLSGTHLMVVLAGEIDNATTIAGNTKLTTIDIPQWIKDKIIPTFTSVIEVKSVNIYAYDWTTQNWGVYFVKSSTDIYILTTGSLTTTADRTFRIQFDLLIDQD